MPLLRHLALQVATGFGIAAVFVAALLLADPGGIGRLLLSPSAGWLPIGLLWLFTGMTFGMAQFAVSLLPAPEREDRGRLVPIPAHARAVRRRRTPSS
ncbi:hypothetical protein [Roseicella aquatilis]|uniref:Uncharacterized protein n=1 Tax=Roseicella aquatilis TaxID=2527868 RepID=A0A4R4DRU9_9PROT|nr:hypothetical protein [Roseicella aquatilis]TCZ65309.1 hypothetical protein EXY23_03795 [Roseicella aquatilis]